MALFLTAVLVLSSLAMAGLLYAKEWEMRTGNVLFANSRPRASEVLHRGSRLIEESLPSLVARLVNGLSLWLRTGARATLARSLMSLELALEKTLHALKHKTVPPPSADGQASAFLREVADYKRKLLTHSRGKGTTLVN